MILDTTSLLIGLVLGIVALSPIEQARIRNYISMGKENNGVLRIKRKGKGIVNRIVNFNKDELKTPEGTFSKNPEAIYMERGIPVAFANDETVDLVNLDAPINNDIYEIKCYKCGTTNDIAIETLRPLKNPKKITDIVLRAISWGMTAIQDKRTQMILLAIGGAILVGLVAAFFGWQTSQAIGGVQNQIADLKNIMIAGFNATVKK